MLPREALNICLDRFFRCVWLQSKLVIIIPDEAIALTRTESACIKFKVYIVSRTTPRSRSYECATARASPK